MNREQLIDRARRGDAAASSEVYRQYAPGVAAYLRSQHVDDVVGLTNDVFMAVFSDLGRFTGTPRQFRSWLFTIAHGCVVDERRHRSRAMRVAENVPLTASIDPLAGDVEDDALAELGEAEVGRLLAALTTDQRDVLLLRVVADLPVDQVAAALGKAPNAVRAIHHRALATLRRQLGTEPADASPDSSHHREAAS